MHRPLSVLLLAAALTACSTASAPLAIRTPSPAPAAHATLRPAASPAATTPARQAGAPVDAVRDSHSGLARLHVLAPELDAGVLALALEARQCALRHGTRVGERLAVIDYSRPSTEKRLWVFQVDRPALLYREYVAHGRNSGDNYARSFSNREGSLQSSLGLFTTAETYVGGNGYSLRMDGLEPGVNDAARARAIVMHGAPYVNPALGRSQGRLGRSWGCPALRPQVAHELIDTLKGEQTVFAYYPDDAWLQRSRWFGCSGRSAGEIVASARALGGGGASDVGVAAR